MTPNDNARDRSFYEDADQAFGGVPSSATPALHDGTVPLQPSAYALRLDTIAAEHDVPMSTLRALMTDGRGPRTFTIGRLQFCRRVDWNAWIDRLAETGGTGPINAGARRTPLVAVDRGN